MAETASFEDTVRQGTSDTPSHAHTSIHAQTKLYTKVIQVWKEVGLYSRPCSHHKSLKLNPYASLLY